MEVDAQTHTYEDICRFLELKDCRRSGKFEKAVNLFNFEVDFPGAHLKKLPVIVAPLVMTLSLVSCDSTCPSDGLSHICPWSQASLDLLRSRVGS